MKVRATMVGVILACGVALHAEVGGIGKAEAVAAFERLKTLVGRWEGTTGGGKVGLTYELVAGGTALLERETAEARPEMVTLFHLDGDRLLLTHYCMAGNQPRMQLRGFDPSAGELRFEFVDGSNLPDASAGHMHNLAMRLVDANLMATDWQFYEKGQPKMTESVRYTRVR